MVQKIRASEVTSGAPIQTLGTKQTTIYALDFYLITVLLDRPALNWEYNDTIVSQVQSSMESENDT